MFIYQANNSDCGFASLKMLLANEHKDRNYLFIKKENKKQNYNLKDLVDIAKSYNTKLVAYKLELSAELLSIKGSFLAVVIKNDAKHMVYIKKVTRSYFLVYDPSEGKKKIKINDFYDIFDGEVLEIKKDEFVKTKCPNKKEEILSKRNESLLVILEFLSLGAMLAALSTIAFNTKMIISLLLFVLYASIELIFQKILQNSMKKYDLRFLPKIKDFKKEKIQESYMIMQNEKKSIFSSPIQLIIGVLIFASIIVTFAFNGAIYVSVMLGATLIFTIVSMLFFNNISRRKLNLELSERMLLEGKDIDINDFVDNTYNVTSMFSLKRFLSVFLSICGSVLLMIFLKEYELNFVLFYFFMILFALDKLNDVLSYLLNSEEREKLEVQFRDIFF